MTSVRPWTICWANRVARPALATALAAACVVVAGCEACEAWVPRSGVAQLRAEPVTGCRLQESGVVRVTDDRTASTQPTIAAVPAGHVLAWVDDAELRELLGLGGEKDA